MWWRFYWCPDGGSDQQKGHGTNVITEFVGDVKCPRCNRKMEFRFEKSNDELISELANKYINRLAKGQ